MIYLDANAGSRLRPVAKEKISEVLASDATNPSSVHTAGRKARSFLREARKNLLTALGLKNGTVIFTSGGTEACNSLVRGFVDISAPGQIITSKIEHPAMLEALKSLKGFEVSELPVSDSGITKIENIENLLTNKTSLVSLMAANNETGAIQPVAELSKKLRELNYSGPIICDFTQAFAKSEIKVEELFEAGVDAISVSGFKIGGPSGVGAIIIKTCNSGSCIKFNPLLLGGTQEDRLRAGTENLLGIAGFGAACKQITENGSEERGRIRELRDWFSEQFLTEFPAAYRLTPKSDKNILSNTLLFRIAGNRADDLVVALDLEGIQVSTGSACASGKQEASHVTKAMGLTAAEAKEVIRISLDWNTTKEDLVKALDAFRKVLARGDSVVKQEVDAHVG